MPKKKKQKKPITKGHSFVKYMTIKNPTSHAHLQIMVKHSAKFQINSIKDVAGVAGTRSESARAITPPKDGQNKNQYAHAHLHIIRKQPTIFKLIRQKMWELRRKDFRWKEGWTEMHTWTDQGHFYRPPFSSIG